MNSFKKQILLLVITALLCISNIAHAQAQEDPSAGQTRIFLPLITNAEGRNTTLEQAPGQQIDTPQTLAPVQAIDEASLARLELTLAAVLANSTSNEPISVIIWLTMAGVQSDLLSATPVEETEEAAVEAAASEEMTVAAAPADAESVLRQQAQEATLAQLDEQRAAAVALVTAPVLDRLHSLGYAVTAELDAPVIYASFSPQQLKDVATWAEVERVVFDQISQPEATPTLPTVTDSVSAAAVVDRAKAWAWADLPTTAGCYTPSLLYQYNSSRATNRVCRVGVVGSGQYRVELPGLGTVSGMVQVSAYGGNHYCKVASWGPSGATQHINVRCFGANRSPADGRFSVLFYKENRDSTVWTDAYLWADQPTAALYTPYTAYQWNSKGGVNRIRRISQGRYEARLPGMNLLGGTVLATAYGTGAERCKVVSWGRSGSDTLVYVNCFSGTLPVDTFYTLSYMKDVGLGIGDSQDQDYGGYVRADQPMATACYTPNSLYQLNTTNTTSAINTACRLSTGSYRVRFPWLAPSNRTTAQVMAYGSSSEYCTVNSWSSDGSGGTNVFVKCFNAAGVAVNTQFTLLYLTDEGILF